MKEIEELLQIFGAAGHPDLANISKITFYQKGEKLYEIGEVQSKVYLLLDGILRCYLIDDTRSDITDCFMSDRFMAANSADFFIESNRVPSFVGMEALTDASVGNRCRSIICRAAALSAAGQDLCPLSPERIEFPE